MTTKNRRVATYLPPEVDAAFLKYKVDNNLATSEQPNRNDSQAIVQILSDFLGIGHSVAYSDALEVLPRLVELEQKLKELKSWTISEISHVLQELNSVQGVAESALDKASRHSSVIAPGQMSFLSEIQDSSKEGMFIPKIESISQSLLDGLSNKSISQRLTSDRGTVRKHKNKGFEHFLLWSQERDPDGIPWKFEQTKYYPFTSG